MQGFRQTKLDGTDLRHARLGGAFFTGALLRGADLRGAYVRVAHFDRADLAGADLRETVGLTQAQIDVAICDADTKLPDGLIGVAGR